MDITDGLRPVAIDHGSIFNTHSFEQNITELTINETIISSSIVKSLFQIRDINHKFINETKEYIIDSIYFILIRL